MTMRPPSSRMSTASSTAIDDAANTEAGMRTAALLPHFLTSIFITEFLRRRRALTALESIYNVYTSINEHRLPPVQRERDLHQGGDQLENDQDHDRRFEPRRAVGVDDVGQRLRGVADNLQLALQDVGALGKLVFVR